MNSGAHILLVEDDTKIGLLLDSELRDCGHQLDWATNGNNALARANQGQRHYDLMILDIGLPGLNGLELCKRLRDSQPLLPILLLSGRASMEDIICGLEQGADDYVTKPFSIGLLTARISALLRRADAENQAKPTISPLRAVDSELTASPCSNSSAIERPNADSDNILIFGPLKIDASKHRAWLAGNDLQLTNKEYRLLLLFARHPGRAFSRDDLLNQAWGCSFSGYEHTVNTHINRLRNKLETEASAPFWIRTVWGVGYRFVDENELSHAFDHRPKAAAVA